MILNKFMMFLAVLGAAAAAAAERPTDYAYGMPLDIDGRDAIYELSLPVGVYRGVARADLADVRVFNGAGEIVPHAWLPRRTASESAPKPVPLTLFPLKAPAGADVDALSISVRRGRDGTSAVQVTSRGPRGSGAQRIAGYLVDLGEDARPLRAIGLDWKPVSGGFSGRMRVDASDDLGSWRVLVAHAPLVGLEVAGRKLEQKRIELPRVKTRYLRLSWVPGARDEAPPEVAAAAGEPAGEWIEAGREWVTAGPAKGEKPGEYVFDLGGLQPVDRLRLQLPEPNTVVQAEFLVRDRADQPWRRVAGGVAYRLRRGDSEIASPEIAFSAAQARYWLVRVDQRGGGVGALYPKLEAGWVPHRLVFAARGAPPFIVAYGNRDAKQAALAVETLIPGYREGGAEWRSARAGDQKALGVTSATAQPQKELGGAARRDGAPDWKRWSLWGALVLGVLGLGFMAWRLVRQMGQGAAGGAAGAPRDPA